MQTVGFDMHPAVKYTFISLAALLSLLILSVLVLGVMDWNVLKGPVARFASQAAGKQIAIEGDLKVRLLSLHPAFSVEGLRVANPKWTTPGNFAEVGRLAVELRLLPLFIGDLVLSRVEVEHANLDLYRDAAGRGTWESGDTTPAERSEPAKFPAVQRFVLRDSRLRFVDDKRRLELNATVSAEEGGEKNRQPFHLDGSGTINGQKFALRTRGGALININRRTPYTFTAEVEAGETFFKLSGTVSRPFDMSEFEADLDLRGPDLADFYYLTELALPNTPPYSLSGQVRRRGTRFDVTDLAGKLGSSDVRGKVSIETDGGRVKLTGDFISDKLNFSDLAAPLGATAGRGLDEKKQSSSPPASQRLLPDAKLDMRRVRAMDAAVKYRAESVNASKLPLRKVSMDIGLQGGALTIKPLSFDFPQGAISADVRIDATAQVPRTDLDLRLTRLRLEEFLKRTGDAPPALQGSLHGRAQLHGSGRSVHEVASNADGKVMLVIPSGEIRQAFVELTGINVARGLGLLLAKDQEKSDVRCGVAAFEAKDGKLNAQTIVFDTTEVRVTGEGGIDLESEKLDLKIKGQPKKLRLVRVRSPIEITGVLRKPKVGVEAEKVAAQGGVAVAVGALLSPVAALLAFVDPGLAEDANCRALLSQAKDAGVSGKLATETQ